MKPAVLALADGTVFEGWAYGAEGEAIGEVVFNTSMSGYQEILTDPSYKGQIVTMTYPLIGNTGVNPEDVESRRPFVEGFVVKEGSVIASNWRATQSLEEYLRERGIVGIQGIDTRALTRHIRDHGAQEGIISTTDPDPKSLVGQGQGLARPDRPRPGEGSLLRRAVRLDAERLGVASWIRRRPSREPRAASRDGPIAPVRRAAPALTVSALGDSALGVTRSWPTTAASSGTSCGSSSGAGAT